MWSYLAGHISEIIWAAATAGTIGMCTGIWRMMKKAHKNKEKHDEELKKEHELYRNGLLWIEHDILLKQCRLYLQEGAIDVESLENLSGLYSSYRALGGNGTIEKLYTRIQNLPIIEDDGNP